MLLCRSKFAEVQQRWLHLSGSERGFCIDVTFVKHVQMKGRLTVSYYYTV